jgi:large subunit ribosomal protein L21
VIDRALGDDIISCVVPGSPKQEDRGGVMVIDYAIVTIGGKQHKVSEGTEVLVDRLEDEVGKTISLRGAQLLVKEDGVVTDPGLLAQVEIKASIVEHLKGDKIVVLKYKPKKGYKRKIGHRQKHTLLKVEKIAEPEGLSSAKETEEVAEVSKVEELKEIAEAKELKEAR